jgi:two-component system sensor histidine kinase KdpD
VNDDVVRPDPDALLASIRKESEAAKRGRLKIFFGMCPGVGKTYAMLQAARQKMTEGVEVVIGIVETHGRKDTEALLEGMPIVPRARMEYRGTALEEMDLDAILLWHPGLAVVDELAHTNAPGSRHPKRYQDVLELLEAGIDVFTTVNVQHVESRNDTVRQITGVTVRETFPDSLLDVAHDIVLVDLTPEQLRSRLAEGKVYLGDRAAAAAENFFRESNLTALREMSLRLVAEHVDRDLREIMQTQRIAGPWKSGDRLLVAVSASPFSEALIRYTRRLAATMEASWIAANIDTPRALDAAEQARLTHHLALARQLGAEVVSGSGIEIGETLLRIARQHNVTQIVIGKPLDNLWSRLLHGSSPAEWLIRHSGEIDIHLIRSDAEPGGARQAASGAGTPVAPRDYWLAAGLVAAVTTFNLLVFRFTGYWAIALIYLLAVVLAATRLHRGPTLLLASLSAVLWDFLFIPPRFTFDIKEVHDVMMFATYFIVALVLGHLTARLREREEAERKREERSTLLYRLTRALAASPDLNSALRTALAVIHESFGADAAVLLRSGSDIVAQPAGTLLLSAKEESVAAWAFQRKQCAGRFTETLPDAEALHLPLLAGGRAEGVLALKLAGALTMDQRELLEAFAAQLAVFVEKERALQATREAQVAAQSEKLQKTLFDSVSHELKTPLAAMSAALEQPQPDRAELRQAVRRLTSTVNHLLDATRLESGLLQPACEWCEPGELLHEAVQLAAIENREVRLTSPSGLPAIFIDPGLIKQALITLIQNAATYSPPGAAIEVSAARDESFLVISVADRGSGLPPGAEEKIFGKFYRGPGALPGGLGLGLSIARRLVEAHGGKLIARNRAGGGARFSIRLPLSKQMQLPGEATA